MLNSIKHILNEEKLLWQGKRELNKMDKIFGWIMFILFWLEIYFYLFYWYKIELLFQSLSYLPYGVLFSGVIVISPIIFMSEMFVHLRGPG